MPSTGSTFEGFVQLRRGLLEHTEAGKLGLEALGLYTWLLMQVDVFAGPGRNAGAWIGSVREMVRLLPSGSSRRTVQQALNHLIELGWVKVFEIGGVLKQKAYLLDKIVVQVGRDRKRINAHATSDWRKPTYAVDVPGSIPGLLAHIAPTSVQSEPSLVPCEPTSVQIEPTLVHNEPTLDAKSFPKSEFGCLEKEEKEENSTQPREKKPSPASSAYSGFVCKGTVDVDVSSSVQNEGIEGFPTDLAGGSTPAQNGLQPNPLTSGPTSFDPLKWVFSLTRPIHGKQPQEVQRLLCWALIDNANPYWRTQGNLNSPARVNQALPAIAKQANAGYKIPGFITDPVSLPDEHCVQCQGEGHLLVPETNPIYPAGLFKRSVVCSCCKPDPTPWRTM